MHPVRATLTTTTNPLVLVVVVWTLLWGYGATQVALPGDELMPRPEVDTRTVEDIAGDPVWEAAWSAKYPGCVALALWPRDEPPVAVVTRTPQGVVDKVAATAVEQGHGHVVGACR
jgi:hypothetical protein